MKMRAMFVSAALVGCTFLANAAYAQSVNPQAENQLQNWIARDPRLQSNPGLMNDPTYLRNHPNFATWLQQHPNAHQQVEQMGAYDSHHQWRNRDWWAHNRNEKVEGRRPEWMASRDRNVPTWNHDQNNSHENQHVDTSRSNDNRGHVQNNVHDNGKGHDKSSGQH